MADLSNGEPREQDFFDLARAELARAREKFGPINGPHEGYAVLAEEVDELRDAVKKQRPSENPAHFLLECVQIAAMAGRFAVDLELAEYVATFSGDTKDATTLRKLRERAALRGSPAVAPQQEPVAWTDRKQLEIAQGGHGGLMWNRTYQQQGDGSDIPLYASPVGLETEQAAGRATVEEAVDHLRTVADLLDSISIIPPSKLTRQAADELARGYLFTDAAARDFARLLAAPASQAPAPSVPLSEPIPCPMCQRGEPCGAVPPEKQQARCMAFWATSGWQCTKAPGHDGYCTYGPPDGRGSRTPNSTREGE